MTVYRTEVFDLPVAGEQGLITSLLNVPPYLVIDESRSKVGELMQPPKHFVLNNTDIAVKQKTNNQPPPLLYPVSVKRASFLNQPDYLKPDP